MRNEVCDGAAEGWSGWTWLYAGGEYGEGGLVAPGVDVARWDGRGRRPAAVEMLWAEPRADCTELDCTILDGAEDSEASAVEADGIGVP